MSLRPATLNACEEIDAALFSGDEFIESPAAVDQLLQYVARWTRELTKLQQEQDGV